MLHETVLEGKKEEKRELHIHFLDDLNPLPTLVLGLDLNLVTFVEGLKEGELRVMEFISWCCRVA